MSFCRRCRDHFAASSAALDSYVTLTHKMRVAVTCRSRWDDNNTPRGITLCTGRVGATAGDAFEKGSRSQTCVGVT